MRYGTCLNYKEKVKSAFQGVHLFRRPVELMMDLRCAMKLDKVIQRRIPFIEQILPKNGVGAELGVLKGHFSPILFNHSNAKKMHLIDPWYFLAGHWHWAVGNQSTVSALIKVLKTFKGEAENGQVQIHVGDDLKVLNTFPDNYFDWVYIDTSHEYEHTKKELHILANKVKDTGVISGDDWRPEPDHIHHGVYQAVNEFVASEEYTVIYSNENNLQWAIKNSKELA